MIPNGPKAVRPWYLVAPVTHARLDVLIFGGGIAGLWALDRLRRAGWSALLLESQALGAGQTIQAQGIIHGGGKYALRGVRDFEAVRAIRGMPELWRRHHRGELEPSLAPAKLLSPECHLWLPRGSLMARLQAWGFMSVVKGAGLLATPPRRVPPERRPEALRGSSIAVYSMAEPVFATASVIEAISRPNRPWIVKYDPAGLEIRPGAVRIASPALELAPRAIVLAAGAGNERLLEIAGAPAGLMQRRPLAMILLRGKLPPLHGHCVAAGKTRLTVTTSPGPEGRRIWQVGGELAERAAGEPDDARIRPMAAEEIRRWLPGFELSGVEMAVYRAVRAEAATSAQRRPSGVHVSRVAPNLHVAWPTKLALAPVLADEVLAGVGMDLGKAAGYDGPADFSGAGSPAIATYPWENAEWSPVP